MSLPNVHLLRSIWLQTTHFPSWLKLKAEHTLNSIENLPRQLLTASIELLIQLHAISFL